jgi:[ribosomal protein S5]-alanine N-acetyltransferase
VDRIYLPELLQTDRLILAKLRYEDAEEIFYTYSSKEEATKFMAWPTHRSVDDTRSFLEYAIGGWRRGTDFTYSIRLHNSRKLIGSIGLMHEEGRIQFGYILTPTEWGRGYATEACRKVMGLVKTNKQLNRVSTFVDVDNKASIKVLEKSGLIRETLLTQWFRFINQNNASKDCILFSLPLER